MNGHRSSGPSVSLTFTVLAGRDPSRLGLWTTANPGSDGVGRGSGSGLPYCNPELSKHPPFECLHGVG